MKTNILKTTVAALALVMVAPAVNADAVVTTKTHVHTQDLENVNKIQFSVFDLNNDGKYAKSEVGTKLFYVFDRDGNEVIDNIEWDDRSVYTITPMEKETYVFVDYDHDGHAEASSYTYETFYQESGLIHFDKNKDGLSPSEFIGMGYKNLDDNDNNLIELDEWKEAYMQTYVNANAEPENYN